MSIIQDVKITATDPIEFLKVCQEAIIRGARYKAGTYVSVKTLPLMAEMTVEIEEDKPETQWKDNGPNVWAIPLTQKEFFYSKEFLEALPIEEIRPILASRGIKGRDKKQMIREYLESFEVKEVV